MPTEEISDAGTGRATCFCAACTMPMGDEAHVMPVFVNDGDEGPAHVEPFCPQCFYYVRGPQEPERFGQGLKPIACLVCKTKSLTASGACFCGSRHVLSLPPVGATPKEAAES